MPGRPNLAAISGIAAASFSGSVYRVVPTAMRDRILSTEGNRIYPGRWHVTGETGILYTSTAPETALREMERHASRSGLQGGLAVAKIEVRLQKVLDLTKADVLSELGLAKEALVDQGLSLTQSISLQARRSGFQGLLVPSATGTGTNLVIFENHIGQGCKIEVAKIDES